MTLYHFKCGTEFYEEIMRGMPAAVRKNDRNYRVGDVLDFQECYPDGRWPTGRHEVREVVRVTKLDGLGPSFEGWVKLSLKEPEP